MFKSAATATALIIAAVGPVYAGGPGSAQDAHDAYLAAINANDLDALMAAVTDDIVLIAPNAPAMAGKDVVGGWVAGYFDAVETAWEKTSLELVVSGDWAFERYAYTATDTPHGGGAAYTDSGNGINIYRKGDDGVWRVARDAWATDRPAPGN